MTLNNLQSLKYINPYTDFGFKKLFGEEGSKDLLVDFLNELLPTKHHITDLKFNNSEVLPKSKENRKAFFDLYCTAKNGEQIIIEMQKSKFNFFKDRSIFYTSFPIQEQDIKNNWNFELKPIYFIAILDFIYDLEEDKAKFLRDIYLKDQDCEMFYDKLNFKFLQMPIFKKKENELKTHFEKWCYFLKNLESFQEIPNILKEPIFEKGFEIAKIANLPRDQIRQYNKARLDYLGLLGVVKTGQNEGYQKGKIEGIEEGKIEGKKEGKIEGKKEKALEIAKNMKIKGMDIDTIISITGLTKNEIEEI